MKTSLFDYDLPPEFIAQQPAEPRDSSRLLVLDRATGAIEHRVFRDIGDYLRPDDLLIANDSRVIHARLFGRKATGGRVEVFLLRQLDDDGQVWECLVRGRGLGAGAEITLETAQEEPPITATVTEVHASGERTVRFSAPMLDRLETVGEVPLPPYITAYTGDRERYQTVYSRTDGSVAAPTAGLHFTPELLIDLRRAGVGFDTVTLHVGLDTFQPVTEEDADDHVIHTEWATLDRDVAKRINDTTLARRSHRRRGHDQRADARMGRDRRTRTGPLRYQCLSLAAHRGVCGQRPAVHPPRLSLPRRRCAHHQLSPAALHAAHARQRVHRPGAPRRSGPRPPDSA